MLPSEIESAILNVSPLDQKYEYGGVPCPFGPIYKLIEPLSSPGQELPGKANKSKSTLTGDFLFKKKDKKETSETEERPEVVNKEALV